MIKSILLYLLLIISSTYASDVINKEVTNFFDQNSDIKSINVWIFFSDKGPQSEINHFTPQQLISERTIKRRLKMGGSDVIKYSDIPVNKVYIKKISEYVSKIRKKSRWLNAVSAEISPENLNAISTLGFVKEVRLMRSFKKHIPKLEHNTFSKTNISTGYALNYGPALSQLEQINVPLLHEMDLSGAGVVIAILDNGFNLFDTHEAMESLDVIGTYDFTRDTTYVFYDGGHGTYMVSALAAYSPGMLIGPAYGASFLLAITEINSSESSLEEDHWVAGLEWAEANGADIVSSSVGYGYYASGNPPNSWYTWEDMDGETAITSMATITAEANGLIVVNSAGNEGYNDEHNTLLAPSDGEFVITVAAVNGSGDRLSSSSVGPTSDGRIKPDVAALGLAVWVASSNNSTGYLQVSGTSASTPLVSGSIALLLEAFPNSTPQQIRDALKSTASQAGNPDNLIGWGVIDAKAAYDYLQLNTGIRRETPLSNNGNSLNTPNPFSTYTTFRLANSSKVKLTLYDVLGRVVLTIKENQPLTIHGSQLRARGTYFYKIEGVDIVSGKRINQFGKMLYLAN